MIKIHQDSKNVMFVFGTCKMIKKVPSYLGLPLYIYIHIHIHICIHLYILRICIYINIHRTQLWWFKDHLSGFLPKPVAVFSANSPTSASFQDLEPKPLNDAGVLPTVGDAAAHGKCHVFFLHVLLNGLKRRVARPCMSCLGMQRLLCLKSRTSS